MGPVVDDRCGCRNCAHRASRTRISPHAAILAWSRFFSTLLVGRALFSASAAGHCHRALRLRLVLFGLFATPSAQSNTGLRAISASLAVARNCCRVAWVDSVLVALPEDARFGVWTPTVKEETAVAPAPLKQHTLTRSAAWLALVAVIFGVIVAVARPPQPTLGPRFTAERARVVRTADSVLRARGVDPAGWRRLTHTGTDTLLAWPRFVHEYKLISRAQELAATYEPAASWLVRYVHSDRAKVEQRTEEWRIRVRPDGRPLDVRHIIADSARRSPADPARVRQIAIAALARRCYTATFGKDSRKLRALRKDVTVTCHGHRCKASCGAAARRVRVAGDDRSLRNAGSSCRKHFSARQTSADHRALVASVRAVAAARFS